MRLAFFYHSLISDWNHGNAHFLRGVAVELMARGHDVRVFEPRHSWSLSNLLRDQGEAPVAAFRAAYPRLASRRYGPELDLDEALDGADVTLVHEWNEPALIARIGAWFSRAGGGGRRGLLLFHDTHHRAVSAGDEIAGLDLSGYHGVLAFGASLAERYRRAGWASRVFVWHEAADVRRFAPLPETGRDHDVVFVGNWGDGERGEELRELLVRPVAELGLRARVYGVRYPEAAIEELVRAGIRYGGWLPNFLVPEALARARATVHVPRRPYVEALPGIPTIRVFEALACATPLVSGPWRDTEELFTAGRDYLVARDRAEMKRHLRDLVDDEARARALGEHGRATVLARHTCRHRVDELFAICEQLGLAMGSAA